MTHWRMFFVLSLFAMLVVGMVVAGSPIYMQEQFWGWPIHCVFELMADDENFRGGESMLVMSYYILLSSWLVFDITISLYPEIKTTWLSYVFDSPGQVNVLLFLLSRGVGRWSHISQNYRHSASWWKIALAWSFEIVRIPVEMLLFCTYILLSGVYEVLRSEIFICIQCLISAGSSISDIFQTRHNAWNQGMTDEGDENAWSFGQLLPLALLIVPCLGLFDTVQEARHKRLSTGSTNSALTAASSSAIALLNMSGQGVPVRRTNSLVTLAPTSTTTQPSPVQRVNSVTLGPAPGQAQATASRRYTSSIIFSVARRYGIEEAQVTSARYSSLLLATIWFKVLAMLLLATYTGGSLYSVYEDMPVF